MLRVALAASILALTPLPAAPRLRAQQAQPPAAVDQTPSDPVAVGFLQTVVDARVYTLEGVGAARMKSRVKALLEVTDPRAKVESTRIDLDVTFDYGTGAASMLPVVKPAPGQENVLAWATAAAQNAFSVKPSRMAGQWRVAYQSEGEQVRLDYLPRVTNMIEGYSEWHKADGTPLRRRVAQRVPKDGVLVTVHQEVVLDYEEVERRVLLKELKPVEAEGQQFAYRFEYGVVDGFHVLKKLVQENVAWRLTLDFDTKVERPAKK